MIAMEGRMPSGGYDGTQHPWDIHGIRYLSHINKFRIALSKSLGCVENHSTSKAALAATHVWWDHLPLQSCPAQGAKYMILMTVKIPQH